MKRENDFQAFISVLEEYDRKEWSIDFLEKLLVFNFADYRLHFFKSRYYRKTNNLSKAVNEMLVSISLYEQIDTHMPGLLPYENSPIFVINGRTTEYVKGARLYFYAGELFAEAGLIEDSLKFYKSYHQANRVKSHYESTLYSFRPFNEYSLSDLVNNEITLVHPSEFNDPFDTLVLPWTKRFEKSCKEKNHIEPYRSSFDYFRVKSFVKDTSIAKAYKNVLMWSHYADEHRGFCIKYRFEEDFTKETPWSLSFRPILYTKKNEKKNLEKEHIDTDLAFCTKQFLWRYENEVRLIAYMPELPDSKKHFNPIPMGEFCHIDSIYFGIRCGENVINTIKNILKSTETKYYHMTSQPCDIFNLKAVLT
jgi:hypothetical protein